MRKKRLIKIFLFTSLFWILLDLILYLQKQIFLIKSTDSVPAEVRGVRQEGNSSVDLPSEIQVIEIIDHHASEMTLQSKLNLDRGMYIANELYPHLLIPSLGNGGKPAKLPLYLRNASAILFNNHSFDSVLSDRISLNRLLPDARGAPCIGKHDTYPRHLPTTTVIVCFHNEALSVLLRTVHSVLSRTPRRLLADLILVDDFSSYEFLQAPLRNYLHRLNNLPGVNGKILLLRNNARNGLVRSRLRGAQLAKGDVLTFLDSHCEATIGWVEPLLARIKENKRNVVCPVIEVIDAVDFSYKGSKLNDVTQVGGFTWDLFFTWKELKPEVKAKRKDDTEPLRSPTMAGGLFSIHKEYFYEMGSYDPEMDIWGGENLEMSFRIWMCGGNLEIVPCSRVGHIFRKENSPYNFPNGVSKTLAKNFNRLAEVWMDEYKELYYRRKPEQDRKVDIGDISKRISLRKTLKCHSFKWYIENIIPDMIGTDPTPPAHGEVRNIEKKVCVDSLGKKGNKANLKVYPCHGMGGNQFFVYSKHQEIIFNDESCLDYSFNNKRGRVELWECHGLKGNQEWEHVGSNGGIIKHVISQKCLDIDNSGFIIVNKCGKAGTAQTWKFGKYHARLW